MELILTGCVKCREPVAWPKDADEGAVCGYCYRWKLIGQSMDEFRIQASSTRLTIGGLGDRLKESVGDTPPQTRR